MALFIMLCGHQHKSFADAFVTHPHRPLVASTKTMLSLNRNRISSSSSLAMMADDGDIVSSDGSSSGNNNYYNVNNNNNNNVIPRDVIVIGGGLAGLSTALRIATTSSRHVTLIEREGPRTSNNNGPTTAGSFAAAGMLAPQSERLPAGPLLDICLESRGMYGEWIKTVERGAMEASCGNSSGSRSSDVKGEGYKYLWQGGDDDTIMNGNSNNINGNGNKKKMEPWETGFHCTGGFLAPAFAGDAVATWSPQPDSGKAYWLDEIQVRELEPMLHPNVIGGWWFPEDASVDARRLTCSLRAACAGAGVQMQFGQEYEVKSLEMSGGKCNGVHLANGKVYQPKSLVVANGSWMRHLLPLPVTPHKGQSFSLRMDANAPPILSRVLFAQDTYIVPKADGRIIVGATVEPGTFDGMITPSGMLHCMSEATRLVPALAELPIEEQWAGLRPTTPDKCPLLGGTEQWDNVYLAGGYWRNGVLLAPKTGQLIGDLIVNDGKVDRLSPKDRALLEAFSWERFTTPGGGKALAANARYAATFYPVHKRSTTGIAASVGTELGFYEGAGAAKGDREKDRQAMFGLTAEDEEALEKAALTGIGDAEAFSFGDESDGWMKRSAGTTTDVVDEIDDNIDMEKTNADPDAFTVGAKEDEYTLLAQEWSDAQNNQNSGGDDSDDVGIKSDLSSIYEKIKANKAKASETMEMGEKDSSEEKEDPGFRIYHVDKKTGESTVVPPFTSPGEFLQMKEEGKLSSSNADVKISPPKEDSKAEEDGQPLFDGYTAIREAYGGRVTAEETAEATRSARMKNRVKTSEIDESKIGAKSLTGESASPLSSQSGADNSTPTSKDADLSSVYEKIRSNKAKVNGDIVMGEPSGEEKPKLNFTIYHVDSKSKEVREVPQYTSPGEFLDGIEEEQDSSSQAANTYEKVRSNKAKAWISEMNGSADKESLSSIDESLDDGSDEKTYDGYQAIMSANSASSREEELKRMKEARIANRAKADRIDSSFQL